MLNRFDSLNVAHRRLRCSHSTTLTQLITNHSKVMCLAADWLQIRCAVRFTKPSILLAFGEIFCTCLFHLRSPVIDISLTVPSVCWRIKYRILCDVALHA